jgi:hypothetical protein
MHDAVMQVAKNMGEISYVELSAHLDIRHELGAILHDLKGF